MTMKTLFWMCIAWRWKDGGRGEVSEWQESKTARSGAGATGASTSPWLPVRVQKLCPKPRNIIQ